MPKYKINLNYEKIYLNRHLRLYAQCNCPSQLVGGVQYNNVNNIFRVAKKNCGIKLCGLITAFNDGVYDSEIEQFIDADKIKIFMQSTRHQQLKPRP